MKKVYSRKQDIGLLALILSLTPLTGVTVDVYVPSLPYITHYFKTSPDLVRLTVTVYILDYALFQVFYGSLSDSFGRKHVLIFS